MKSVLKPLSAAAGRSATGRPVLAGHYKKTALSGQAASLTMNSSKKAAAERLTATVIKKGKKV